MRALNANLTTTPQRIATNDDRRGFFMIRNTHATATIYVQFGGASATADAFPVLAGDVLTIDRGDLSPEIWLWSDIAHANNQMVFG